MTNQEIFDYVDSMAEDGPRALLLMDFYDTIMREKKDTDAYRPITSIIDELSLHRVHDIHHGHRCYQLVGFREILLTVERDCLSAETQHNRYSVTDIFHKHFLPLLTSVIRKHKIDQALCR